MRLYKVFPGFRWLTNHEKTSYRAAPDGSSLYWAAPWSWKWTGLDNGRPAAVSRRGSVPWLGNRVVRPTAPPQPFDWATARCSTRPIRKAIVSSGYWLDHQSGVPSSCFHRNRDHSQVFQGFEYMWNDRRWSPFFLEWIFGGFHYTSCFSYLN